MSTLNQRLTVLEFSGNGSGTSSTPQVYFKVNSNLSTNQVFSSGTIAQFNNIVFVIQAQAILTPQLINIQYPLMVFINLVLGCTLIIQEASILTQLQDSQ